MSYANNFCSAFLRDKYFFINEKNLRNQTHDLEITKFNLQWDSVLEAFIFKVEMKLFERWF